MLSFKRIAALACADGLERSRRPAFLVTLGVGLWAAWVFCPPNHSVYTTLQFGNHRGLYGSAWLGCTVALLTSVFFSFAGFYIVKNAIAGDRATGVGAVLAATPTRNVEYTLAKWLSNTAILAAMMLVILLGAAGMQLARGEDPVVRPLVLAAPFLLVTLPALALTSAVAVLFEAIPGLRGGMGNLVYFFLWITCIAGASLPDAARALGIDPLGVQTIVTQMLRASMEHVPDLREHPDSYSIGLNFKSEGRWDLETFAWEGPHWSPAIVLVRWSWVVAAGAIAALAALPFDRFAGEHLAGRRARRKASPAAAVAATPAGGLAPAVLAAPRTIHSAAALPGVSRRKRRLALVLAEWRLLTARSSWMWWASWLLIQLPGTFAPREVAARFAAVAWIWPVLRWSALGARDREHGTTALLDASPHPVARQLPSAWLAGAVLALIAGAGFTLRALATGDATALIGALAGAAFVPALALALGTLTGGRKTFEVLYVVLWYCGPLNGIPFLDFTGGSGSGPAGGFALAAALLLALAAWARVRRRAVA